MSVTIKDVAKEANVAPSTVSRVLSDSPRISEKTKIKVRKVIDELGYHLNHNARVLVQKKTQTIGIVMKNSTSESLHDPFFPEVVRGISAYCSKMEFNLTLTTGESEEDIFQDVIKMVQGKRVDGMIVSYSKKGDQVVPYLVEHGIPFVLIGSPLENHNEVMYVDNNNVEAAREATTHLINLNHERIGFIGGDRDYQVSVARYNGYKTALIENKLIYDEQYSKHDNSTQVLEQMVNDLMDLSCPPTGLVVTDDLVSLHVLQVLEKRGIQVPNDVSIISFNNAMIAQLSVPPLTSVDTKVYQLGYESGKSLIDEINEPSELKKSVVIPTEIKQRESCGALLATPQVLSD
ncbi:MAG TPA: LacI family DNA-binding transcriptional regulator [Virgibacillus sp.]|nr:LacI family DNA-binding transcriptional regulator [Virgibacillus sp.]